MRLKFRQQFTGNWTNHVACSWICTVIISQAHGQSRYQPWNGSPRDRCLFCTPTKILLRQVRQRRASGAKRTQPHRYSAQSRCVSILFS
ncbi:hypothetical protein BDV12DRAFT_168237 [Aspergillus spectabilis]